MITMITITGRTFSPAVSDHRKNSTNDSGGPRAPAPLVAWRRQLNGKSGVRWRREKESAVRRGMAIKRLREDEEDGGSSFRQFSTMRTVRGDLIFTQRWAPVDAAKPRGLVILLHGLNEHSGRYNHFAKQLNASGFEVYAMDWIGHGGSDGLHGYIHSIDFAVHDLRVFIGKVLEDKPSLPLFIFGHSTGAAIVLKAVEDPSIESLVKGIVLTSPAIHVHPFHPIIPVIAPILSFLVPEYQFIISNSKGLSVSHDPDAVRTKYSDPLVYTGPVRVRTGYEILKVSAYLQQNLSRITVPFLVLHGTADIITDPEASQRLYTEASSQDKSIKLYEGLLHDLLFEIEKDEIAKDIIDWFSSRLTITTRS